MVIKDKNCYYKDIEIKFYECDNKKRSRLETIMAYMADIAGIAYAAKGFSHTWLWEHNFVFLLSRSSIHVNRMPVSDEVITIETWEREVKGVLFYRDVIFYDKEGNSLVECSTAWVLANPHTRSILKPSAYTGEVNPYDGKKADCLPPARLKIIEELNEVGKRKIVYSDIDANNHVYNAVYAAIACDYILPELMDRELIDFRINFKQEAVLGEILTIKTKILNEKVTVVGEIDGTISFECEFTFK
ncbi:MAG: acyl-ACP thioesterase domain-containing protein [Oscillospiraceae bacterium]